MINPQVEPNPGRHRRVLSLLLVLLTTDSLIISFACSRAEMDRWLLLPRDVDLHPRALWHVHGTEFCPLVFVLRNI